MNVSDLLAMDRRDLERLITESQVIFGLDASRGGERVLFYGREALARMVRQARGEHLRGLCVDYDQRAPDELESLDAICVAFKGKSDYESGGPVRARRNEHN